MQFYQEYLLYQVHHWQDWNGDGNNDEGVGGGEASLNETEVRSTQKEKVDWVGFEQLSSHSSVPFYIGVRSG